MGARALAPEANSKAERIWLLVLASTLAVPPLKPCFHDEWE